MSAYRFDSSYRIGRCRCGSCEHNPAFAWKAYTGLRLGDVRCPRCGFVLDRTSREVRSIRELTPAEEESSRERAIAAAGEMLSMNEAQLAAWQAETDPEKEYAKALSVERFERSVVYAQERIKRLRNGRELAAKKRRDQVS